jgi:hypothetical protein
MFIPNTVAVEKAETTKSEYMIASQPLTDLAVHADERKSTTKYSKFVCQTVKSLIGAVS